MLLKSWVHLEQGKRATSLSVCMNPGIVPNGSFTADQMCVNKMLVHENLMSFVRHYRYSCCGDRLTEF